MQRRTFLHLSTAALAALGLSACGAKPAASVSAIPASDESSAEMDTDTIDDSTETFDIGMTLEEAQASSDNYHNLFILRNGKFYALFKPTSPKYSFKHTGNMLYYDISTALLIDNISFQESFAIKGGNQLAFDTSTLFDGDQLVYISSDYIPNSIDLMSFTDSLYTIPLVFEYGDYHNSFHPNEIANINGLRKFSCYDPNYIPADSTADSSLFAFSSSSNLTINGLSVQEYCTSHNMVPIYYREEQGAFDSTIKDYNYRFIVDLTPFTEYDSEKEIDGILEPVEENSENKVTISYYKGTQCYSFTLTANCLAYLHEPFALYTCPLSLTPNGYAIVDTSLVASGEYAIGSAPDTTVRDYTLTAAYGILHIM